MTRIFDVPPGLPSPAQLFQPSGPEESALQSEHHRRIFESISGALGGVSRKISINREGNADIKDLAEGILIEGQSGFLVDSRFPTLHPNKYGQGQPSKRLVIGAAAYKSGSDLFLIGEPYLPISFPNQWRFLLGVATMLNTAPVETGSSGLIPTTTGNATASRKRSTELLGGIHALLD